jgi:hypothetical protein
MRTVVKKTGAAKGRSSPAAVRPGTPIELPDGMWQRIAQKAYELWEQRGRQAGNDLRDWFDAEGIVMEEIHEARE